MGSSFILHLQAVQKLDSAINSNFTKARLTVKMIDSAFAL